MNFVCELCCFEMDYDDDENEVIECDECCGNMFAVVE